MKDSQSERTGSSLLQAILFTGLFFGLIAALICYEMFLK